MVHVFMLGHDAESLKYRSINVVNVMRFGPDNRLKRNRLKRVSGEYFEVPRKPFYNVELRFSLPHRNRTRTEDRLFSNSNRQVQKIGGFSQTRGLTLDKIRKGKWHRLPYRVRSRLVKGFLQYFDKECERGLLEIKVDGVVMGKSNAA